MTTLRKFVATIVLTLAIAFSAFAGDMSAPGVTSPPPPPPAMTTSDIDIPDATSTGETSVPGEVTLDPVTEAALGLLQSILSLF